MHGERNQKFMNELLPLGFSCGRIRAGHTMRQLNQRDYRNSDVFSSDALCNVFQSLPRIQAVAFYRDQHTGIKKQAHGLIPRRGIQRVSMNGDCGRNIAGEILVDRSGRVSWQQRHALFYGSPRRRRCTENSNRGCSVFDYDLCTRTDARQQGGEIACCFSLRDAQRCHIQDDNSNQAHNEQKARAPTGTGLMPKRIPAQMRENRVRAA